MRRAFIFLWWSTASFSWGSSWDVDPEHSAARFSVKHLTISEVHGTLGDVKGTVELDDTDESRIAVDVTIDARDIDTRNKKRDAHLRSKDFLDVRKYPHVTFKSTHAEKVGERLHVAGDLTLRGTTRPVTLEVQLTSPVQNPFDKTWVRGVKATTVLRRGEFGLRWNAPIEKGFLVDPEVKISIDVELRQRAAK